MTPARELAFAGFCLYSSLLTHSMNGAALVGSDEAFGTTFPCVEVDEKGFPIRLVKGFQMVSPCLHSPLCGRGWYLDGKFGLLWPHLFADDLIRRR